MLVWEFAVKSRLQPSVRVAERRAKPRALTQQPNDLLPFLVGSVMFLRVPRNTTHSFSVQVLQRFAHVVAAITARVINTTYEDELHKVVLYALVEMYNTPDTIFATTARRDPLVAALSELDPLVKWILYEFVPRAPARSREFVAG